MTSFGVSYKSGTGDSESLRGGAIPSTPAINMEDLHGFVVFDARLLQLAERLDLDSRRCGFESRGEYHDMRYNPSMTTPEEDQDMVETADKVIAYAGNPASQRTVMLAAFRLFHSMGYRRGYGDAMDDAAKGKDLRVKAHLN